MKSRYGVSRTVGSRPVLPVVEVLCDDTRTAVAYFKILKQEMSGRKIVKVVPAASHGATAEEVIGLARTTSPVPNEPNDACFALIDLDTNPNVQAAATLASSNGVILLLSNPCFEVWTLSHLQDTGEMFMDCGAVLGRLKLKWKEAFGSDLGPKAQARYEKISSLRHVAIERCKRRNPQANLSWTEVWRAVEFILS